MNRLFLLLSLAGLLLAAGCRKDDVVDCAPVSSNSPLKDFTRRNGVATQTFTINLGQTQSLTTRGGAIITFPAASFLTSTNSVATGTAQVRIREIYSVADMVLSNMPTSLTRYGNMLVSGGEFNIQVWGTQRLRLQAGSSLTVQSPIPPDQDTTQQYIWKQTAAVLASDTAGWQLASMLRVQSLPGLYRSLIPLDSIGWWNIDQYWHAYRTASIASVTIITPANPLTDTRVYLRPVGFNGLARIAPTTTGTSWQASMPVGAEMIAVVLQSINGQLYYGTQKVFIQNNLVITPTLTAVSEADAVRLIRQL
jgi:outer membrane protein assembly factor BamB